MEYMFWYAYAIKQDLCPWRLKNFPFALSNGIFGGSGCQYKETPVDTSSPFCHSHCSLLVWKVKIQHDQSSNELLNIREVEVYDQSGANQALYKPASQSSTHSSNLPASKVVDGNTNSDNFSATNNGSGKLFWLLSHSVDCTSSILTLF